MDNEELGAAAHIGGDASELGAIPRMTSPLGLARSGPGQPPEVTDAELVCLAVAQVLLRFDGERYWLPAARKQVGHMLPRLLGQSEYKDRLKATAPLMEAALRGWRRRHRAAVSCCG